MTASNLKMALAFSSAMALSGCAATMSTAIDQAKGYTNQALSAVNNQTHDRATGITYDDATGKPSLITQSDGNAACSDSDELRGEVKHIIATNQSPAALMVAHTKFQNATQTCAQFTAFKLGDKFGCALENGRTTVKATGIAPATPNECSDANIMERLKQIKTNEYMPGGKYNP
jgi:hypothetical protein|tara:strand:+ start:55368 stop:55889 length:522 start_codon:yes stop_codon:yes gene_type:complete